MKQILIILSVLFIAACHAKKEDPVLAEAAAVHEEAMQLFHELEDLLKELEQNESIAVDAMASIKIALQEWEENLVEVPGYEHDHEHEAHGHHHHHHAHQKMEVTSDEMLLIQKEIRDNINNLLTQAKALIRE
ncbi:MAG TPA: hypothetical protein PKC24_08060 [Cyclobacteriaceae bacterium]|nr:hypothetical protein [Cyclobacteriaceae bacterium]